MTDEPNHEPYLGPDGDEEVPFDEKAAHLAQTLVPVEQLRRQGGQMSLVANAIEAMFRSLFAGPPAPPVRAEDNPPPEPAAAAPANQSEYDAARTAAIAPPVAAEVDPLAPEPVPA